MIHINESVRIIDGNVSVVLNACAVAPYSMQFLIPFYYRI